MPVDERAFQAAFEEYCQEPDTLQNEEWLRSIFELYESAKRPSRDSGGKDGTSSR